MAPADTEHFRDASDVPRQDLGTRRPVTGAPRREGARQRAPLAAPPGASAATLVIGPSWVGDMVMAQCLFKALKRREPGRPIDVAAPPWALPVLARMPEVRSGIELPFRHGKLDLARRIAIGRSLRGRYDRAFVLPGSFKSAILPLAARIEQRIGYRGEFRYGLLNDMRKNPDGSKGSTAGRYQALAGDGGELEAPSLAVDAENQKQSCRRFGLVPGAYVALMPGAEYGPSKRWPAEHFARFGERMLALGHAVAIFGSARDRPIADAIAGRLPGAVDCCGETRLEDAIDLIAGARLAVSNDSGLMHVAAAVATPLVALYGSTSPEKAPPLSARAESISLRLSCSPCGKRVCPLGHHHCMEKLAPELVAQAATRLGAV